MEIGRKIYFDIATGNVLVSIGEMSGYIRETTLQEDFATYKALTERVLETVGVVKLEYGKYAQDFRECNDYRVNPTTLTLEFSYPDPSQPIAYQQPLSEQVKDLQQAIAELTMLVAMPQV